MITDFSLLHYYVTDAAVLQKVNHILKNNLNISFPYWIYLFILSAAQNRDVK